MIEESKHGLLITGSNKVNETLSEGVTTPRDNAHTHLTNNSLESSGFGDGPLNNNRPISVQN